MSAPQRLRLTLGERGYDIVIGSGLFAEAGALLAPAIRRKRAVVVTDEHVAALHLARFAAGLAATGTALTRCACGGFRCTSRCRGGSVKQTV